MPSLDTYKRMIGNANTIGQVHKNQSDMVMEMTWYRDIDAKTAWFYDMDHDEEFDIADDLHPDKTKKKIPIDVKMFEMEYNSLSKDETGYHLIFKPSFNYKQAIPYYDEKFHDPLGSDWPIGMFCDYPDSKGIYHRYLVVGQYRHYSNQFPSYIVLPCDFKLRWIANQKKYSCWGALRSQSSYNKLLLLYTGMYK